LPTVRMATSSSIQLSMITPCLSSVGSGDGRNECQAGAGERAICCWGAISNSKSVVVRGCGSRRVPGVPVGVDVVAEPDARPDTALPLLVRHGDVHFPATVLKVCDGEQQRSNLEVTYLQPTKNTAVCETPPRTSRRG
jgi:hypothetical protein